jgi:hypothetical protein
MVKVFSSRLQNHRAIALSSLWLFLPSSFINVSLTDCIEGRGRLLNSSYQKIQCFGGHAHVHPSLSVAIVRAGLVDAILAPPKLKPPLSHVIVKIEINSNLITVYRYKYLYIHIAALQLQTLCEVPVSHSQRLVNILLSAISSCGTAKY